MSACRATEQTGPEHEVHGREQVLTTIATLFRKTKANTAAVWNSDSFAGDPMGRSTAAEELLRLCERWTAMVAAWQQHVMHRYSDVRAARLPCPSQLRLIRRLFLYISC